jgi:hypothetical protein
MKIGKMIKDGFGNGEYGSIHGNGGGEGHSILGTGIGRAMPSGDGFGYGDHELIRDDMDIFPHLYNPDGDPSDW